MRNIAQRIAEGLLPTRRCWTVTMKRKKYGKAKGYVQQKGARQSYHDTTLKKYVKLVRERGSFRDWSDGVGMKNE